MILFVALILCVDGGPTTLPVLSVRVQLPKWGTTEEETRRNLPKLEGNNESDVGAVGTGKAGWRYQEIDSELLGVRVFYLGTFFDHDRLTRVLFDFGKRLDADENARRQMLTTKFDAMFGEPFETGTCWRAWRADDGVVVVEPGRVQFFAPSAMVVGVDRACLRLVPRRMPATSVAPQRVVTPPPVSEKSED